MGVAWLSLPAVAGFLAAVDAYWIAAALALLFTALRRRPGMLNALVAALLAWLLLRGLGALMRLAVPCLAANAESAFGLLVAVGLATLLPLRLWQRALSLAIVALTGAARAATLGCHLPRELGLAAVALAGALGLVWFIRHWRPAQRVWQRVARTVDRWAEPRARTRLRPTLRAVLAARLRQHLGVTVESLEPVGADGVHASTPVLLTGRDSSGQVRRYFVKIVSTWNWQTSMIHEVLTWPRQRRRAGPLWPSLEALVEYEHYMLLLFHSLGVPAPVPRGVYRLERRAYALVTDYLEAARSLRGAGPVSAGYVTQALAALHRLRQADCAHRDIKESNILVLPGEVFAFVDLARADYVAGPRRQARDLADMLVVLAMHHDPAAVVDLAAQIIGLEGLQGARRHLHRSLLNEETQRFIPLELPGELRRLIGQVARRPGPGR